MRDQLPEYYFRIRENGAAVFRIDIENRQSRLDMEQIAVCNVRNGDIKPHGERELSSKDRAAITDWLAARQSELAVRTGDDMARSVETLNLLTHWVQTKATPEQLETLTQPLLLAMHDLRSVLTRKAADRLDKADKGGRQ